MKTAAIVLNWNRCGDTLRCARSVLASSATSFGLIVVDNGSDDGSSERLRQWLSEHGEVRERRWEDGTVVHEVSELEHQNCRRLGLIVRSRNGGYATGNNSGLRWARTWGARRAWILNNDTVVDPEALSELEKRADAAPGTALVGCCVVDDLEPWRIQCYGGWTWSRLSTRNRAIGAGLPLASRESSTVAFEDTAYVSGASLLCSLEAMAEIGDLCELYFLFHEDHDCARALRRRGYTQAVAADAIVRHRGGATAGSAFSVWQKSPLAAYHAARSLIIFVSRWEWGLLPWVVAVRLCYVLAVLPRNPAVGLAAFRGLMRGVADSPRAIRSRRD